MISTKSFKMISHIILTIYPMWLGFLQPNPPFGIIQSLPLSNKLYPSFVNAIPGANFTLPDAKGMIITAGETSLIAALGQSCAIIILDD